jgi:hypothetical protein
MDVPNHAVTTGIDMDEFYDISHSETQQKQALNEGLKQIAIFY